MSRVLVVEDERRLSSFLEKGLRANGLTPTVAPDGRTAAVLARDREFDLMLLDLGLPDMDGLELLRDLRRRGVRLPTIVLSARDELGDMVAGLDGGADDYVTKPFRFEELLARIRARLRPEVASSASVLRGHSGRISLDVRTREATVDGRTVSLTAREFTMLETLLRHTGHVLSREQLLSHVWGYDFDPASNVVDVYVGYLRRKLGEGTIETVRGMGYVLRG